MIATRHDDSEELFPVVDEQGNVTGSATRGQCHGGSMLLHPVVHLHLFNSRGELYLQRRPAWKDIQPGKWDTAVGGHLALGERAADALVREADEELGSLGLVPQRVTDYVFDPQRERVLAFVHPTVWDGPVHPSAELDGGRFWSVAELRGAMGSGLLTPNLESELVRVFPDLFAPR